MEAKENTTKAWQNNEALRRYQMISPLLDADLDGAKRTQLRIQIAKKNETSVRTIYRYEQAYREGQFAGLMPVDRTRQLSEQLPDNFSQLLDQAILLRREVPGRSVEKIITILEMEGWVAPGVLKRSTLQRRLYQAGYGREQMRMYEDARESSSKRFCKPHRMMLVQGDIKFGPKLPIGKNGAMKQTYLSSAIDDHSRFVLQAQFYDNQEEEVVEDTFRKVIEKYGKFDACYFDNGSQYIAKQLKLSLSRLSIRIQHAKVRSGKSKGKVEKYHEIVDDFIREVKLKNVHTLDELNYYWGLYLDDYYHNKAHNGIREYYESLDKDIPEEGISPHMEFFRDDRPLTYLDQKVVAEAFLHHEQRKVDKGACISFRGKKYETKPELIGHTVEIAYDPSNVDTITVSFPGYESFTAQPVKIGEYCDKNETPPIQMQKETASTSRFLDALEKNHQEVEKQRADAISYSALYSEEGADHV